MKYKRYLQPAMEITESERPQLITASQRGWSQDGKSLNLVEKEDEVKESDFVPSGGGYGGFLDLD